MKNHLFLLILLISVNKNFAQIGINSTGASPNGSAMLDVSSTTKGLLMPRMTSAQRGVVSAPTTGLLVYDTDTKTIWAYNGSAWRNTASELTLPYNQTITSSTSGIKITNQGIGAGLEGVSAAEFGTGLTARATGNSSWGLYAFTDGLGSKSINAIANNGTAIHGETSNSANTNTLMSLLNQGAGKTSTFQMANASSTTFNVQIAGNHLAEQLKIFQTNPANSMPAVSIINSGTGVGLISEAQNGYGLRGITNTASSSAAGVYGENNGTQGNGVMGVANFATGTGVKGESNFGVGVSGYSGNNKGVVGSSISGTALYGNSLSGYALETSGNVKIAGGNTNPSNGAVLTSDATGNATWQQPVANPQIAFRAAGIADAIGTTNAISSSPFLAPIREKIEFKAIGYNFGNGYTLYSGAQNSTSSTFLVPLTGLYHLDASMNFVPAVLLDYTDIEISIMLVRNGATSELLRKGAYVSSTDNTSAAVSGDVTLQAGDRIYVAARQFNISSLPSLLHDSFEQCFFNGHLVFPFGN